MRNKPLINFSGATFSKGAERFDAPPSVSADGQLSTIFITLADGTQFQKSIWYPHNWERWINQELSPHSRWYASHGYWRKVSAGQAEALQAAWDSQQQRAA